MDKKQWKRVNQIVDTALELKGKKRETYLDQQCEGNNELRSKVTQLLKSIEESANKQFLENTEAYPRHLAADVTSVSGGNPNPGSSLIGETIGKYRILDLIGHGGMGSVFLTERVDGAYDKKVALKLMRRGMDTPSNLARFKRERNILANLDHPNIARLLDGGIAEDGLPYLVMEHVDGIPLTDFCNKRNLSIEERCSLFKMVCTAVEHAHQNAIIHRDLKPSNILVTDEGTVKVLDFGIAKLLDDSSQYYQTNTGYRMLTLGYAAPEQIETQSTTTSTDTYTLGVVLYQLLSGTPVFDLDGKDLAEIERMIRSQDPIKPSSQFSQIAKSEQREIASHRASTTTKLKKTLQGDLDAILLKALRKSPEGRYGSAGNLLEDLERLENDLPITARKGTFRYNTSKFIRRNKKEFSVAVGFLLLIVSFGIFYTWQITKQRNQARIEAKKAQAVSNYLISLFKSTKPSHSKGDTVTARQLLQNGKEKLHELNNQPAVQSKMLEVLGNIYTVLSYPQKGDSLLKKSLSIKKNLYNTADPQLASIFFSLATNKNVSGEYDTSIALLDTTLSYQEEIYGINSNKIGKSLRLLSEGLRKSGQIDSAYQTINKSKSIFRTQGDTLNKDYLDIIMELGAVSIAKGNYQEGEQVWKQALRLSKRLYSPPHPTVLNCMNGLANAFKKQNKYEQAESLYNKSLPMTKRLYGKHDINMAVTLNNLAGTYYYLDKYSSADTLYNTSHSILKDVLGPKHPYTISTLYNWANLKSQIGDYENAEDIYTKVINFDKEKLGKLHPNLASDYSGLANLYKKEKKYHQALNYYQKSLQIRRSVYDNPNHPYIAFNERSIAEIKSAIGEKNQAATMYGKALNSLLITYSPNHPEVQKTATEYAHLLSTETNKVASDSLIKKFSNK